MPSSDKVMLRDKKIDSGTTLVLCQLRYLMFEYLASMLVEKNTYLSKIVPAAVLRQTGFATIIIGIPSPHHEEGSGGGTKRRQLI